MLRPKGSPFTTSSSPLPSPALPVFLGSVSHSEYSRFCFRDLRTAVGKAVHGQALLLTGPLTDLCDLHPNPIWAVGQPNKHWHQNPVQATPKEEGIQVGLCNWKVRDGADFQNGLDQRWCWLLPTSEPTPLGQQDGHCIISTTASKFKSCRKALAFSGSTCRGPMVHSD